MIIGGKLLKPRAGDDYNVVPPPSSVQVEAEPRIVLFQADGTPLKRQIGFKK